MPLRLRLTLYFTGFLVVALLVSGGMVYLLTARSLNESVDFRIDQALKDLDDLGYTEGATTLPRDFYYLVRIYIHEPSSISDWRNEGSLFDGRVYADSTKHRTKPDMSESEMKHLFDVLSDDFYQKLNNPDEIPLETVMLEDGSRVRVRAVETEKVKITEYTDLILVAAPASQEALVQLRMNLLRTLLVSFLAFGLLVWLLSQQILSPLQRMTQAAANISSTDLSKRVPLPNTQDELLELSLTLNNMLDRLQESFDTQRRFTADASHELRTPVTAIAGHVNYLLRRTKVESTQSDSLSVIKREAERMGKLVADLLELARADAGFRVDRRAMNVVEVAEAIHMELAPVAGDARIEVITSEPVLSVLGDFDRLKQAFLNLVQNALNAGANRVKITLYEDVGNVVIEIADNGPGIPAEALPHLFERFYRVDEARTAKGSGSGLGLAIVNWVVEQHDGRVTVLSEVGKGTMFTLRLPAIIVRDDEIPLTSSKLDVMQNDLYSAQANRKSAGALRTKQPKNKNAKNTIFPDE